MRKKDTTQNFIEKARKVHGDRYNYSKVEYTNSQTKICIICPEHGEFWQKPNNHLQGQGCPKCSYIERSHQHKKNIKQFIKEARQIHGDKYDYSNTIYVNNHTKICITCPQHGEFWMSPKCHLKGQGCPKCGKITLKNKLSATVDQFIEKAKKIHNNKYDYSKVNYVNNKTKVCIICPKHGEFWQTPSDHICAKHGCPTCAGNEPLSTDTFIEKANHIHNHKYDYSLVNYKNIDTPIDIICPIHGKFTTTPYVHLCGSQCPQCSNHRSYRYTTKEWTEKATQVHNGKYNYSKVNYIDSKTNVIIICPKHGEFFQNPHSHLCGTGCPNCVKWNLETALEETLLKNDILFDKHKTFPFLKTHNTPQSLDFYLPDYNVAIECQGIQHFAPVEYFGGEKEYEVVEERDIRKYELCKRNNIDLIYYTTETILQDAKKEINNKIYLNSNIYLNKDKLIEYVKNCDKRIGFDK